MTLFDIKDCEGLSSMRLHFTLDDEKRPVDCEQTENTDANNLNMIEKFALLTNTAVAQHIAVHLPE
ncbi:hypothetical protein K503DRAFT_95748 [Rhizopogon vinicolor AM-OR11-026]|uniref:Uncharacterized protein n=1 Tax=Rhizopogon vinicolor AM-OR11-026 TaxID=1314800 RepID=A0A1B7N364_9AGAM|nr:hypothetical protein K503DRAFT_95748 [Rhizopogon vinicolor AM-OR11-026]